MSLSREDKVEKENTSSAEQVENNKTTTQDTSPVDNTDAQNEATELTPEQTEKLTRLMVFQAGVSLLPKITTMKQGLFYDNPQSAAASHMATSISTVAFLYALYSSVSYFMQGNYSLSALSLLGAGLSGYKMMNDYANPPHLHQEAFVQIDREKLLEEANAITQVPRPQF